MNVKNQFHVKEDCNKKKKETQYRSFSSRVEMSVRMLKKCCDDSSWFILCDIVSKRIPQERESWWAGQLTLPQWRGGGRIARRGEMVRGETKHKNDTTPPPWAPACGVDHRSLWRSVNDKGETTDATMAWPHPRYKCEMVGLVFCFIFHYLSYTPPPQALLAGWSPDDVNNLMLLLLWFSFFFSFHSLSYTALPQAVLVGWSPDDVDNMMLLLLWFSNYYFSFS